MTDNNDYVKYYRPWGHYINIAGSDTCGYKVKKICVSPGKRLSLQTHSKRSEHWVIIKGQATVRVGDDYHILNENSHIYIPKGAKHRIINKSSATVELIETQIGSYLGEDDIVRYEDDFGRA